MDMFEDEIIERNNLAVIYIVEGIESIKNKDRIELVRLKDCGYTIICEKKYKVGDMVVFIKYDSILPENKLFEFMRKENFRVKAKSFNIKDENQSIVGKIYSQGLLFHLSEIVESFNITDKCLLGEGTDLTTICHIKKFLPNAHKMLGSGLGTTMCEGKFPTHIVSKTDEPSLASNTNKLKKIIGRQVIITKKIDGCSLTVLWDDDNDSLMVCSRNLIVKEDVNNKLWYAVRKYNIEEILRKHKNVILQAECYGIGIQNNKLELQDINISVFNVITKHNREHAFSENAISFCKHIDVPYVPVIDVIDNFDLSFDDLQNIADQQTYNTNVHAEGIVIRPTRQIPHDYWSHKIINRNYKN